MAIRRLARTIARSDREIERLRAELDRKSWIIAEVVEEHIALKRGSEIGFGIEIQCRGKERSARSCRDDKATDALDTARILRSLGIAKSRYHAWARRLGANALSEDVLADRCSRPVTELDALLTEEKGSGEAVHCSASEGRLPRTDVADGG